MHPGIVFALVGALLMALGWPMARRRVRPNRWYGLRTPATFADEQVWYDANAVAGRDMMALGAGLAIVALIFALLGVAEGIAAALCAGVLAAGALVSTARAWRLANKLLRERRRGGGAPMRSLLILLAMLLGGRATMLEAQDARPSARPRLPLELVPDTLAICRLDPGAALPAWAAQPSAFLTVSRTAQELSITTRQSIVPEGVRCERDYRALRVRGPLPLDLVGILAAIADPLAAAGLSIFAISTFETDYVLVKARELDTALTVLRAAGHQIAR